MQYPVGHMKAAHWMFYGGLLYGEQRALEIYRWTIGE